MKRFFVALAIVLFALTANACTICGCGAGNLYLGLYPSFDTKFVGIRYGHSDYSTILKNDPSQYSNNHYNSYEVWSGFNLNKKWQFFTFIPYQSNNQLSDDGKSSNQGLGDITLLTNYNILNKRSIVNDKKLVLHQLWIGAGLKLKTGSFDIDTKDPNNSLADVNAQMGSGSNDFIINARDIYQVENMGIASTINYKINTRNKQGYAFGNKLTLNTIAYYNYSHKHLVVTPNIGLQYENIAGNKLDGALIHLTEGLNNGSYITGGNGLNLMGGLEVGIKKVSFGINLQAPIQQSFAADQTKLNWKGILHATISL
jgi:hypothetical protein